MADITDLINYYVNLLIIQYHNKPKAQATIQLIADEVLASGIIFDIRDGYSVETAVGKQLDVIGKYVGVDRFWINEDPINYFAFTWYDEVSPDAEEKWGFTDYADFDTFQYNGTLNYDEVLSVTNALSDSDYRILIRLKILQNTINHSHKSIDDSVFQIFGSAVVPDSPGNMHMYYFVTPALTAIILAAEQKLLLPRPMAVRLTTVSDVVYPLFAIPDWDHDPDDDDETGGLTDYADYDTNEGNFLIYEQLSG